MNIFNGKFRKQEESEEQKAQSWDRRLLTTRQIAFMMFDHFRVSDTKCSVLDIGDLLNLELKGDNLRAFGTLWDETVLNILKEPDPEFLEGLFSRQLAKCARMEELLSLYTRITSKREMPKVTNSLSICMGHTYLQQETREEHFASRERQHVATPSTQRDSQSEDIAAIGSKKNAQEDIFAASNTTVCSGGKEKVPRAVNEDVGPVEDVQKARGVALQVQEVQKDLFQ